MSHNCGCDCGYGASQKNTCTQPTVKMVYCVKPAAAPMTVNIKKIDVCTGLPIEGVCILIKDKYGRSALSTTNMAGMVSFTVEAGETYTLTEYAEAEGYKRDTAKHTLVVAAAGTMTFDGAPYLPYKLTGVYLFKWYNEPICGCGTDGTVCYVIAEAPVATSPYVGGCHQERHSCYGD